MQQPKRCDRSTPPVSFGPLPAQHFNRPDRVADTSLWFTFNGVRALAAALFHRGARAAR
jgi:hypothetical protein